MSFTQRHILGLGRAILLLVVLIGYSSVGFATTRAVLVGVSDYYYLDPEYDLKGPKNDVREFARFLVERGVKPANITVLSDPGTSLATGIKAIAPKKTAILAALDQLAHDTAKGDRAIFYFSGHGSLQPDVDGDEMGGRDEIFLPADVGLWSDGIGAVKNAITDDELRLKMQAIRKKGATLFAIIDACHAATGFRSLGNSQEMSRFVPESSFGVPDIETSSKHPTDIPPVDNAEKFAYFYATQADQRAYEHPAIKGGDDSQWYGDFTFTLLKVMRQAPGASYRQVMQAVKSRMQGRIGAKPQQPDIEGTVLDEPIWGGALQNTRHRIEDGTLQAGVLHGINNNAVLALYGDAASGGVVFAHARVIKADATKATLEAVEHPCKGGDCVLDEALPDGAIFAEVLENPADTATVFSTPIWVTGQPALLRPLERAMIGLIGDQESPFSFDENTYDLSLIIDGESLIIGGPNGEFDVQGEETSTRFHVPSGKNWNEHLPEILARVSRVHALYKISETVGSGGGLLGLSGNGLETSLLVAKASSKQRARNRCKKNRDSKEAKPVEGVLQLSHCDRVFVDITNSAIKAQDVTALYVDAAFGISALWPRTGHSNRIAYGETARIPIQIVTRTRKGKSLVTGEERIVILSVPVKKDSIERVVLTALTQPGIKTRGNQSDAETYLRAVFYPQMTGRGFLDGDLTPPLNVQMHQLIIK